MRKKDLSKRERKYIEQLVARNVKSRKEYRRETQRLRTKYPDYPRVFRLFQLKALQDINDLA